MESHGFQIVPIILYNIKTKLLVLFLITVVLSFNIIAAEGKEISFHADDKFINKVRQHFKLDKGKK